MWRWRFCIGMFMACTNGIQTVVPAVNVAPSQAARAGGTERNPPTAPRRSILRALLHKYSAAISEIANASPAQPIRIPRHLASYYVGLAGPLGRLREALPVAARVYSTFLFVLLVVLLLLHDKEHVPKGEEREGDARVRHENDAVARHVLGVGSARLVRAVLSRSEVQTQ